MVAASGYDPHETEVVTIASVTHGIPASPGGMVTLTAPLQYDHILERFTYGNETESGSCSTNDWTGVTLAPEVGLLSRNIRIVGDDSDGSVSSTGFGCRMLIGKVFFGRNAYAGKAQLDGIEMKSCGQAGFHAPRDPRYAIAFKSADDTSAGSFVRNCAFNGNLNTGIGIHLSNGITLQNNVLYRSKGSTVIVGGQNNQVLDNMAALTTSIQGDMVRDNHAFDFPATFEIGGSNNRVRGNAAGGSERLSYSYFGSPCTADNQAQPANEVSSEG